MKFAYDSGFQKISSSPEYPRSNDFAEKTVHPVKKFIGKSQRSYNKNPYLVMLEARIPPSSQLSFACKTSCWKTTKISITY